MPAVLCYTTKMARLQSLTVNIIVPDFRSSTGLFKSLKSEHKLKASGKQLFDASVYSTYSSTSSFHDMVRSLATLGGDAQPTAFHQLLAELGREGRLLRLYTQNVDGIDVSLPGLDTSVPLSAKGPWPKTVQLHGGLEKMVCSKCAALSDFEPALFNGPEPPPCEACQATDRQRTEGAGKRSHGVGRLRPRIVLYNEHNPDADAIGAVSAADLRARPDALLVVGTSMKIPGVRRLARELCGVVRGRRDGLTVWCNQDPPPPGKDFEDCWDLVVKGPCDEVARQYQLKDAHDACSLSDVERAKVQGDVRVVVGSPEKARAQPMQLMPTPAASPHPSQADPENKKPAIKLKLNGPKAGPEANEKSKRGRKPGSKNKVPTAGATKKTGKAAPAPLPNIKTMLKTTKANMQPAGKATKPARPGLPAYPPSNPSFRRGPGRPPLGAMTPPRPQMSPLTSPVLFPNLSPQRPRQQHPLQQQHPPPLFPNLSPVKTRPPHPGRRLPAPPRLGGIPRPDSIKAGSLSPTPAQRSPPQTHAAHTPSPTASGTASQVPTVMSTVGDGSAASSPLSSVSEPLTPRAVGEERRTVSPSSCPRGLESLIDLAAPNIA